MNNLINKVNQRLDSQSGFLRSVLLLLRGTAIAHIFTLLILPIVTRLYNPEDFSKLAVYSSLLGIFSVISCLRYNVAIPLPKRDEIAERLLIISIISSIIFFVISIILLFFFSPYTKKILGNGYFEQINWILPLGILAASLNSAFIFWFTRKRDFRSISKTKIKQSVSSGIIQLFFGWLGLTAVGLLIAQMFYSSAGLISLFNKKKGFEKIKFNELKATFIEYIHYPKYSVAEALFNTAGNQLPILIIASIAAQKEAGYLLLASKIMVIPMVLIGTSISQVYYAHATEAKLDGKLPEFTLVTMNRLALIGSAPLLFIGIIAPTIFPLIFGMEWERAGMLVSWMTPWFIIQFIVSPVSLALHVNDNQKLAVILQLFGLIMKIAAVWLSFHMIEGLVSEAYAVSSFAFYIIYLLILKISLRLKGINKIFFNRRYISLITISIVSGLLTIHLSTWLYSTLLPLF